MGCSVAFAFTRSPTLTWRSPVRPEIGARTEVCARSSAAEAAAAESASTPARAASVAARFCSFSEELISLCANSVDARSASSCAECACARERASVPRARAYNASKESRSSSNRVCPARTSSPSRKRIAVTMPPTWACTVAEESGSTVPTAASSSGTVRRSAIATVTGTRGERGSLGLPHPARSKGVSKHRPTSQRRRHGLLWGMRSPGPAATLSGRVVAPSAIRCCPRSTPTAFYGCSE